MAAPAEPGRDTAIAPLRLSHDSTVAELVPMHLRFLALTLLTLGVYHFWARTHARRFLWSRTRLLDEPFIYLGRPVELLAGFVLAIVLLVLPVLALNLVVVPTLQAEHNLGPVLLGVALTVLQVLAVPYLIFVGGYAARRYRLSRTAWRGIRGAQGGSAWTYGLWGMFYLALTGLTFGWFYPWQRAKLARRRLRRARFGSRGFACDVAGRDLVGAFAILWFGTPLAASVLAGVLGAAGLMAIGDGGATDGAASFWLVQLVSLVFYVPSGLLLIIYRGLELRQVAAHTSFGDVRFEFRYGIWQYVGYAVGNVLILIGTLATGWIYVQRRQLKFWERHLVVTGSLDFADLRQADSAGPRTGEGLAELFDTGFEIGF